MAATLSGLAARPTNTWHGIPAARAAYARPWPSLPADAHTTPGASAPASRIQVVAPRPLKDRIGFSVSTFSATRAPLSSSSGVSRRSGEWANAGSSSRAARSISSAVGTTRLATRGRICAMPPISRGFRGRRRRDVDAARIPPGQYVVDDFPVLSAGPTPRTPVDEWSFMIDGQVDEPVSWPWEEFLALPSETVTVDIHCVTKWSKLDTTWAGVSVDTLLGGLDADAGYVTAFCDGGYTTNLPLEDGEVSPYLAGELRPGDRFELRGPIGGYFVWDVDGSGPLNLVAGGSG